MVEKNDREKESKERKDKKEKHRSSRSKRSHKVPKSVRWQKNLTSTSPTGHGLKKLSCSSLNCTEKLTSMLMCQKGYASIALYAVFALFILAFIYTLWKIVSANTSRSGQNRRPENPTKVSPTAKAPTWSEEDEEELKKFFPAEIDVPTRGIEKNTKGTEGAPTMVVNPTTLPPSLENVPTEPVLQTVSRLKGPVFGEDVSDQPYQENNQQPIIGEDYMPVNAPYGQKWPPINFQPPPAPPPWQALVGRHMPWTLRQRQHPPSLLRDGGFQGQFDERGRFSFEKVKSKLQTTNGLLTSELPSANKVYDFRENSKVRNEHTTNQLQKSKKHHQHHSNHHNDQHHSKSDPGSIQNVKQRNELELDDPMYPKNNYVRDFILRPHKNRHHHGDHSNDQQYYEEEEEEEEEEAKTKDQSDNDNESDYHDHRHHSTHHHHHQHHSSPTKPQHRHYHHSRPTESRHHQRHHSRPTKSRHHHVEHHTHHVQEKHKEEKHHHNGHRHTSHHQNQEDKDDHHRHPSNHHHHPDKQLEHQQHSHHHPHHHDNSQRDHHHHSTTHQHHHQHKFENLHQKLHRHQASDDTDDNDDNGDDNDDTRHNRPHHLRNEHKKEKQSHQKHNKQEDQESAKAKNVKRLHHIMDFKHYLKYKKHHSVDEEVHGKWTGLKKKIKVCTKLKRFSANGKVLLTRTLYKGKYLYTVLVCNVVHIRKHSKHRTHSSYKKTQLCYKLYFVTTATVQLNKKEGGTGGSTEFEVNACKPSKVHYHSFAFRGALAEQRHLHGKKNTNEIHRDDIPTPSSKRHHKKKFVKGKEKKRKKKKKKKKTMMKKSKTKEHLHKSKHHSTKHKNKKVKGKKSHQHSKNSEDVFFNKLLNVLSIVNKNKGSKNSTTPLSNLKTALQKMKKDKEVLRKKKKKHNKSSKKHNRKPAKKTEEIDISSPAYINKLLSKILPAVVNNVKNEIKGKTLTQKVHTTATPSTRQSTTTPPTTPTTQSTTKPQTTTQTTTKPPPTTRTTPQPTTKAKGIEDELKDVLPLLLKKMQLAKQTTTTKPTTKPPTQGNSKVINDLLARLGLAKPPSKPTRDIKTVAKPSHTKPTIAEKLDDLSLPSLPDHQIPQINPPSSKQPFEMDPFAKHILCFGDSLTNGYYNHGHNFHPYSMKLKQLLNSNSQTRYDILTSGKTGEMAHESMNHRLPQILGNSSRFDWVILLAGTNDVAHVKNFGDDDSFMNQLIGIWAPKIFQDIVNLHQDAYRYGARTVLLTIPESAYEAWPQFKVLWIMRKRINQELRQFAARSQGRTILCDLAVQIPRHSLSPQLQKLFWNDHLHLTPLGYDKMAEIVYKCLKPYLQ